MGLLRVAKKLIHKRRNYDDNNDGYLIVLTADRTLMSDYNGSEFIGFAACGARLLPDSLYKTLFCPSVSLTPQGAVEYAPCGLRKIEAALIEGGFSPRDVIVAHPEHLELVVGSNTKVIGISTNDPLGLGPASTTFSQLMGRESYNAYFFRKLTMDPLIRKYGLKVIVGGAGSWQLTDERLMAKYGIDTVCLDECETVVTELFQKAVDGKELPPIVKGEVVPVNKIPHIRGGTINGLVEIARGCGRGCRFCVPTMQRFRCRSLQDILTEVDVNLRTGLERIILHAEDVLRYMAKGVIPNEEAVIKLVKAVRTRTSYVTFSHFALASVKCKPTLIRAISEILNVGDDNKELPWIGAQTGIETGSPRLATEHLRGKAKPFPVERWADVVRDSFAILHDNHWVACGTLILGMPDETTDDIIKTIELIEDLKPYKSFIVPLFFVPIGNLKGGRFFRMKDMKAEHWQLLAVCARHDFRWLYPLLDELCTASKVRSTKYGGLKLTAKYVEHKIEPFLRRMEQGEPPLFTE